MDEAEAAAVAADVDESFVGQVDQVVPYSERALDEVDEVAGALVLHDSSHSSISFVAVVSCS